MRFDASLRFTIARSYVVAEECLGAEGSYYHRTSLGKSEDKLGEETMGSGIAAIVVFPSQAQAF